MLTREFSFENLGVLLILSQNKVKKLRVLCKYIKIKSISNCFKNVSAVSEDRKKKSFSPLSPEFVGIFVNKNLPFCYFQQALHNVLEENIF